MVEIMAIPGFLVRRSWTYMVGVAAVIAACSSGSSGGLGGGDAGASATDGGEPGSAGEANASGASGPNGQAGRGGSDALGEAGADGDPGTGGSQSGEGPPLPDDTLLYIRHETKDHDVLVALDLSSGEEHIVTDLTGDGSSGWEIDSFALSPDRRRIALASLYGPTKADTDTGLATRRIWTLSTDGTDFRRLTPTFLNAAAGRQNFQYDVGDPAWTADGSHVLYDFGTYWWEGTNLEGGSFPWIVAADGKSPPTSFPTPANCSVLYPSRNPVTGEFLFIHSVCIPGQGDGSGVYLYPEAGSENPELLVPSGRVEGKVDVYLYQPQWFPDGTGFLFLGGAAETDWEPGLLAYELDTGTVSLLSPAPEGMSFYGLAISPDASKLVYCLRNDEDGAEDLHLLDLAEDEPVDIALTNDGKSCSPSF